MTTATNTLPAARDLKLLVAPHIVEDLGLNLYTSLPKVLVEFIANAYDADAPDVTITLDTGEIAAARQKMRELWKEKKKKGASGEELQALADQSLPDHLTIEIEDHGCGMSTDDLEHKFLVIGRRRRTEKEDTADPFRSKGGRLLMGRKGIGKLAGFGVAKSVEITSRAKGEQYATRLTLNYEDLSKHKKTEEIAIPAEVLAGGGGISPYGTKIVLKRLGFEATASQLETMQRAIGDSFYDVLTEQFVVKLNGSTVKPTARSFAYVWPNPETPVEDMVTKVLEDEDGGSQLTFQYRIRFTGPKESLAAKERGIRVYSHGRLANAPDLLDLKTGMHGFRNTHYLDGVVRADFIDDQSADYIGSNRQGLRWDTSLLTGLRAFLSQEMETAIKEYQKKRDADAIDETKNDQFSKDLIENAKLPKHRKKVAFAVAAKLAAACQLGASDPYYKETLPILVSGLGQGDILQKISDLATAAPTPDIHDLLTQATRLTAQEFADFVRVIDGRLAGIEALDRIYKEADFKNAKNEGELHELFKRCPWLINPMFTQFLTSNESEDSMNEKLAKKLEIGSHLPNGYNPKAPKETTPLEKNERPDLVFLLSNLGLHKLVIVELKAPNTPLHLDHLTQLKGYILRAQEWLAEQDGEKAKVEVYGYLIGSRDESSKAEQVKLLRSEIKNRPNNANWDVFDVGEVLDMTRSAHRELIDVAEKKKAEID
jgi:hypothetical protein